MAALLSADSFSLLLMVVFSIFFGRIMGAELFGLFSISFVISTFVRLIIEAGYEYKLPRDISADPGKIHSLLIEAQSIKNLLIIITFPLGVIIGIIAAKSPVFIYLMIWNAPLALNTSLKSSLRGLSKMNKIAKYDNLFNFALYLVLFLLLLTYPSIELILLVYAIIEFAKSAALYLCLKKESPAEIPSYLALWSIKLKNVKANSDEKNLYRLIKNQIGLAVINFAGALQYRIPLITLGWLGSAASVGYYSAAMRFLTFARVLPGAILNVLLPEFSKRSSGNASTGLFLYSVTALILGLLLSAALYFLSKPLMMLTFGYVQSVETLQILSWTFTFVMLNQSLEAYLLSRQREKMLIAGFLATTAFVVILSILFIPGWQEYGAAYCALAGEFALSLIYVVYLIAMPKK